MGSQGSTLALYHVAQWRRHVLATCMDGMTSQSRSFRKDRCLMSQLGVGHKCSKGCGLIEDGGLDNLEGGGREVTTRYHFPMAEELDLAELRLDLRDLVAAERAQRQQLALDLPPYGDQLKGQWLCQVGYDRVWKMTKADYERLETDLELEPSVAALWRELHSEEAEDTYREWYEVGEVVDNMELDGSEAEAAGKEVVDEQVKWCDRCGFSTDRAGFSLQKWRASRGGDDGLYCCKQRPWGKCTAVAAGAGRVGQPAIPGGIEQPVTPQQPQQPPSSAWAPTATSVSSATSTVNVTDPISTSATVEARAEQLWNGWADATGLRHEAVSAAALEPGLRPRVRCMHQAIVTMLEKHLATMSHTGTVKPQVRLSGAAQENFLAEDCFQQFRQCYDRSVNTWCGVIDALRRVKKAPEKYSWEQPPPCAESLPGGVDAYMACLTKRSTHTIRSHWPNRWERARLRVEGMERAEAAAEAAQERRDDRAGTHRDKVIAQLGGFVQEEGGERVCLAAGERLSLQMVESGAVDLREKDEQNASQTRHTGWTVAAVKNQIYLWNLALVADELSPPYVSALVEAGLIRKKGEQVKLGGTTRKLLLETLMRILRAVAPAQAAVALEAAEWEEAEAAEVARAAAGTGAAGAGGQDSAPPSRPRRTRKPPARFDDGGESQRARR